MIFIFLVVAALAARSPARETPRQNLRSSIGAANADLSRESIQDAVDLLRVQRAPRVVIGADRRRQAASDDVLYAVTGKEFSACRLYRIPVSSFEAALVADYASSIGEHCTGLAVSPSEPDVAYIQQGDADAGQVSLYRVSLTDSFEPKLIGSDTDVSSIPDIEFCDGVLYAVLGGDTDIGTPGGLASINTATGDVTSIGKFTDDPNGGFGLFCDEETDKLYAKEHGGKNSINVYEVDKVTGDGTFIDNIDTVSQNGATLSVISGQLYVMGYNSIALVDMDSWTADPEIIISNVDGQFGAISAARVQGVGYYYK